MVKIKLGLFEGIACCTILPSIVLFFTIILSAISVIVPQQDIVYIALIASLISSVLLLALSLLVCRIIYQKSTRELRVSTVDKTFQINGKVYYLADVKYCKYYVCKWYFLPFLILYKQGNGGMIDITFVSGEHVKIKVLYRDYLKLRPYFSKITEV